MSSAIQQRNTVLRSPIRNRFFYGKLMDVHQWEMEQGYTIGQRRLLTRLGLGVGVLCGLRLRKREDGTILLTGGAACDDHGRHIIVPPPGFVIEDPFQPTDEHGCDDGERVGLDEPVTVCLEYHECAAEPVPTLVAECGGPDCVPGATRERFRVRILRGAPEEECDDPCDDLWRGRGDCRDDVLKRLSKPCPALDECCVPLATLTRTIPDGQEVEEVVIDEFGHRQVILSNQMLLELILCLADRIDCRHGRHCDCPDCRGDRKDAPVKDRRDERAARPRQEKPDA